MANDTLTSVPSHGKFTLGKKYEILDTELWTSRYAEFEVNDDNGQPIWICCGHFNTLRGNPDGVDPKKCPCCKSSTPPTIQEINYQI